METIPDYLSIPASELGKGTPVKVRILGDLASLGRDLAQAMFDEILAGEQSGRGVTMIVPVGPVDQFPILAQRLNEGRVSCRHAVFINMDEYLADDDRWISAEHPLSFRGYMQRRFYDLLDFSEIPNRKPYVHNGRQIDGSLTVSGTTYLVELKLTTEQAGATDIDTFHKVTTKADNTMGAMVSISGSLL